MRAKEIARIYNSPKGKLENAIPLSTPYSIHIDPCSLCNFKCKFCFQSDEQAIAEKGLRRGMMTWETFDLIMFHCSHFTEQVRKVKIGLHGEPTLHPRLVEMIKKISGTPTDGYGVKIGGLCFAKEIELFTNGSLLNPVLNEGLVKSGLTRFNISVEGLGSNEYKKMTGIKLDMGRFVKNITNLYEVREGYKNILGLQKDLAPKIYIKTVSQDKKKFYKMFGDICDEIYVENVVPQWSGIRRGELKDSGMYGQKAPKHKLVCPFPFMYLHFNWDGTVSPCTLDWAREVLIGDIRKETALEIWRGEKLKQLQIKMLEGKRSEIPFCKDCLAPMVCCNENLDDHRDELLERIK